MTEENPKIARGKTLLVRYRVHPQLLALRCNGDPTVRSRNAHNPEKQEEWSAVNKPTPPWLPERLALVYA